MKLFVATPAYGGNVHVQYMKSMLSLQSKLAEEKIGFEFFTVPFDSLIPRARNVCAMQFLKSDATHMMFIDADIMFNTEHVIRMLRSQKELVCGIYAKKAIDFEKVKEVAPKCQDMKELTELCARYNVNLSPTDTVLQDGFLKVHYAPTGFMMIHKEALRAFVDEHPELEYKNDIRGYGFGEPCYDIFKCGVINARYLSEDYYFCHLWKQSKRDVWVDFKTNLGHIGPIIYHSNPFKLFQASS